MSKINKISVLGIRSFDNVRSEVIEFYHPLTLIVGLNGSGKTTIIECLKYAATGDVPPGTGRGGPWISDPKLCGEKEVLGQVKLSFMSTEGLKMVCTRSMQLTVKKNAAPTFHALESGLVISRGGERLTTSAKKAEMDNLMPQYLGVSKAVLDTVIFCHQEDSLWPLGQSKDLKENFDAIFEAVKYTKALENIKVLAKKQRDALGLAKKDEEHSKVNKAKGEKVRAATQRLVADIEDLRDQAEQKREQSKEATARAEGAFDKRNTAGAIVYQMDGKRGERDVMTRNLKSLQENLEEMDDSDKELQDMIDQYDERVRIYEGDYESSKDRYRNLEQTIKDTGVQVSAKERDCGSYESQKENHDRQLQNRERLIKETARSHSIRGFDVDIDDQQVQAFMERIGKMVRDQNAEFERVKQEIRDELAGIQARLQEINGQKTSLTQRKESARQIIARNETKISNLQSQLNSINVDEGTKAAIQASLRETEARLETAKLDAGNGNQESSIEGLKAELRKLNDRKEILDAELVEGSRQAEATARLDLLRNDLKTRQSSLETMTGAHGEKIASVVGPGWTAGTLETRFQRSLDESSTQLAEAEKQRDGTSRELQQTDFKLSEYRSDLKSKRAEIKQAEKTIRDATGVEASDYPERLREIEEGRDIVKADSDSSLQILNYFEACIKTAKKGGCRTCERSFANDKERDRMINAVQNEIKKLEDGKNAKDELPELEKDLQDARAVRSNFDTWERLTQKEIPEVTKNEKELSQKRDGLLSQLEDQDAMVNDRESAKRSIQSLSKTVQTIANYRNEIANIEAQIEELVAKQKTAGLSRGLDIIQEEVKKVGDESRSVNSRLDKSTGDRDRSKAYINSLELEKRDITSKLSTAEYQLKEKAAVEGQIEELKGSNAEQRETTKAYDNELTVVSDNLKQTQAKYDDASRRGDDKHTELQADVNKLNSSLNKLKVADDEIKAYIDRGGPQQLARGQRELKALRDEVGRLETERRTIMGEVKALEDKLRSHSETRRGIADNQRYRREVRALEAVSREITELEKHNAEADHKYWEREGTKWQTERNKLNAEEAGLMGQLGSKDQELVDKNQELESEYKNAARAYKEAHIKVETTKACIEDLGRYGGALDKAIMKYHSLKMEEINRIVDELWRRTYQGTDVDTIIIRSEAESGTASKKTHNYRVCMVKQDTEMDMRGRCSAGQKVLACIIIRLALAECFGVNCGLIALDEPTTNLDRDNIRALAESLGEIIKIRQKQKNFQLIVITHDEDFLRYMGCSDYTEYYYRVSRNERQKSVIERQNIAEVM